VHRAALGAHEPGILQLLHRARYRLATGADHLGDGLVRGRALDYRRLARGPVEEEAGDPAGHVEQDEAGDLLVGLAQPARQLLEEGPRDARHLLDLAAEVLASQHVERGRLHGQHVGRARPPVEEGELAEVRSSAEGAEDDLAPVLAEDGDLHLPGAHHVQRVARVALADDQRAARHALLAHQRGEHASLVGREPLEDGDVAEELGDARDRGGG
jgi:hypothetical protein